MNERSGNSGQLPPGAKIYTAPPAPAAVSWDWLRGVVSGMHVRYEPIGGQTTGYVQRDEVLGWIEEGKRRTEHAAAAPISAPAAVPVDERFPGGLQDAIAYVNEIGDAAGALYVQTFGDEDDGSRTELELLQEVMRRLVTHPQPAAAKTGHFTTDEMLEATAVLRAQQAKPEVQP